MPDQEQKQRPNDGGAPWDKQQGGDGGGPRTPNINKPDTSSILKKLKTVAPDQAKNYRQRTGQ